MSTQKKLIETYQKAQKKLVEIIKRKQAYGSAAAYERSLLRQIQKELKKLKKSSKALVEQLIKENYKTGLQSLIDDLLKDDTAPRLFNMFSGLNTSQIELITQNANIDLNKSINIVGRRMQDAVREAGIEATAEKLTTGQTIREMQKNLEKKLKQQNLTAVEYANGTKMPIEKYAETVARSTTAETQNKAKVIQGQDWGYDLVRFTEHSPTCEVCSMYQGRVYALTKEAANGKYTGSKGQELHFPYLYDTALISGYSTIHPNCRHRLYFPQELIPFLKWRISLEKVCSPLKICGQTKSVKRMPRNRKSSVNGTRAVNSMRKSRLLCQMTHLRHLLLLLR